MTAEQSGWKPTIFLYGPPGVGKSGIGRCLAQNLGLPFVDLDEQIEQQAGLSIPEIFAREGEAGFRQRESSTLERNIDGKEQVIALGGGALINEANRRMADRNGRIVLLNAAPEILQERLHQSQVERPLLGRDKAARLPELLHNRGAHYQSFALQLNVGSLSVEEAAWMVQVMLGRFQIGGMHSGPHSQPYPVRVIPGGLQHLPEILDGQNISSEKLIITDSNIAPIYKDRLLNAFRQSGSKARIITVSAGEASKTLDTARTLWEQFLELGLDRSGMIIAFGGGMITDLVGFAASLYMRGIQWAAVPTTLLGMVDASLGGKTGVNLPGGKNLVGSFYPPALVLADSDVLATLPPEEFRSGMAEVVKHGVIADPELFDICSQGLDVVWQQIDVIVCRAMAVKVRVVVEDPFEAGSRESLNLGHTLGHALEKASAYSLRHGEAVALGMAAIARYSARAGYLDERVARSICETLAGLGLPTHVPDGFDRQEVERIMFNDKKKRAGKLRFVIPLSIGYVKYGVELDDLKLLWEAM